MKYSIHPSIQTRKESDILFELSLFEISRVKKIKNFDNAVEFFLLKALFYKDWGKSQSVLCLHFSARCWSIMRAAWFAQDSTIALSFEKKENFCMVICKSSFLSGQYTGSSSVSIASSLSLLASSVFYSCTKISALEVEGSSARTSTSKLVKEVTSVFFETRSR